MSALGASQPEFSRTEAQLVEAARGGDDRAFEELYERYGRAIFAYVLGLVKDHGRAEDIVQDIFISALRRMRSSDRAISFKPWIYEIAKNACIDEFRRVRRSPEVPIEPGGEERLVSAAPSSDTCFEQDQQLATLHGAFRGLSPRQHKVMVLRELEGLTYAEIAARTGMTVPMVESTLLRARRRLSEEYAEIASGRRCQQVHAVIDRGGQAAVDALRVRERRRFARHVAHCQPCARCVQMAGVTAPETGLPAVAKKIAGLLPFPVSRWLQSGRRPGGGPHTSGLVRSARKAAHFANPGASIGATPATVATVAAIVFAGGGATIGLIAQGQAAPTKRGPATVGALPAAAVTGSARPARPRRASRPVAQANSVSGTSGRSARVTRTSTPRTGQSSRGATTTSRTTHTTTPAAAPSPSTPPAVSTLHIPSVSPPSGHLPVPVPKAPLSQAKSLLNTATSPVRKVVKKLPGVVNKLPIPQPPGGLGLPKSLGDLPSEAHSLPTETLGGVGGL
jgi:RNA polymerase sigma factor (sigma-70 family)